MGNHTDGRPMAGAENPTDFVDKNENAPWWSRIKDIYKKFKTRERDLKSLNVGDRIEVKWPRHDSLWRAAIYKGKDINGRADYITVAYEGHCEKPECNRPLCENGSHQCEGFHSWRDKSEDPAKLARVRLPIPAVTTPSNGFGALTTPGEESGSLSSETRRRLTSAEYLRDTSHHRRLPVMEGLLAEIAEAQARA